MLPRRERWGLVLLALDDVHSNGLGMVLVLRDYKRRRTKSNARDTPICK